MAKDLGAQGLLGDGSLPEDPASTWMLPGRRFFLAQDFLAKDASVLADSQISDCNLGD